MTLRRKLLVGVLVVIVLVAGAGGVGLLALVPDEGPELLRALPIDADVIAYAEGVDPLWRALESSEGFEDFKKGPAWRALAGRLDEAGLAEALEALERWGLELSRSTASHLVGREVGLALWLDGPARRIATWLAAFRVDTYVCAAEFAAGRLFLRDGVKRTEEAGSTIAELERGPAGLHWFLLGDLLVVSGDRNALLRALEGITTRGDDTSFAGVFNSGLKARPVSPRAGVRLGRPEEIIEALLGAPRARPGSRAGRQAAEAVRALGLPAPVDRMTIAARVDGTRVLEEAYLASPVRLARRGAVAAISPPPGTFLWWRFRPGKDAASDYVWAMFARMVPPEDRARGTSASGVDLFRQIVVPRVGTDVALALADQEVAAETGGFPAQYSFVGVRGAALLHAGFEQMMRSRSLGVYSEGERLPVSYPYVVRRSGGTGPVYEMAIRDTRRFEGFRPSVAVRAEDVVYCSSFEMLVDLLKKPPGFARPATIFPDLGSDGWMAGTPGPDGRPTEEVFRLEWRPPKDFRQLANAYDYLTELRRHRGPVRKLLADDTDYGELWLVARDLLERVRRHSRVGFDDPGGLRMRAVWDFGGPTLDEAEGRAPGRARGGDG